MLTIGGLISNVSSDKPLTEGEFNIDIQPLWVNNITRLNAQNLNNKMNGSIRTSIIDSSNKAAISSNGQIKNLLALLPGYKLSDDSTSEIHNTKFSGNTYELNNNIGTKADGSLGEYQTVFGIGNTTNGNVLGQFIAGVYAEDTDSLFVIGNGQNNDNRSNALTITNAGKMTVDAIDASTIVASGDIEVRDIRIGNSASSPRYIISGEITEDNYATSKKYVDTAIANITAIIIRNKGSIECTQDTVQEVANKYIKDNYDRDPKNLDGLILTITDAPTPNDRILYVYTEESKLWINAGINSVDLSNYYTKEEVDTKLTWIRFK